MRLITSQDSISEITKIAIDDLKRHLKDGELVVTSDEFSSPFWRELVYDLVRLAIVAYPITKKFTCALKEHHKRQQTHELDLWEAVDHNITESIITRGLSSIAPVDFVLFVLRPNMVHHAHMIIYEQFDEPKDKAVWPPVEEWWNAYHVAERYMLLGDSVSISQKHIDVLLPDPEIF